MKRLTLLIVILLALFPSCKKKKQGCMYATAINYDASAEINDCSCIYKGKVSFYELSSDSLGLLFIHINDSTKKIIPILTAPSSCDQYGTYTYEDVPGIYSYKAYNIVGSTISNGSVTITSAGCTLERIKK